MDNNSIYDYLSRSSDGQTPRSIKLIGVLVAIVSSLLVVVALYLIETYVHVPFVYYLIGIAELSLIVVSPSVALMQSSSLSSHYADEERLAILWLTPISPQDMAEGYARAITKRLYWLWIMSLALMPQAVVVLAYFIGAALVIGDCLGPCGPMVIGNISFGILPALIVGGLLAFVGTRIYTLAIYAGVWTGFRLEAKAPTVAGIALLIICIVCLPLLYLQIEAIFFTGSLGAVIPCLCLLLVALLGVLPLTTYVRKQAHQAFKYRQN